MTINGLPVAGETLGDWQQSYEVYGGRAQLRFADGSGITQQAWTRLRTTISGSGWAPAPILALCRSANTAELGCIEPLSVHGVSNIITLPTARRSGGIYAPTGWAVVDGRLTSTPLSLVGDTATLTQVPGAVAYEAHYYPLLTVMAIACQNQLDGNGAVYGWSLTAEEV